MKNFFVLLAKGLAIAVLVALGLCYFAWSLVSLHRLIWFIVALISIVLVREYWKKPRYVSIHKNGLCLSRFMTTKEKIILLLKRCGLAILYGLLMFGLGRGCAAILNLSPEYWEIYVIFGLLFCIAVICIGLLIAYVITLIMDSTERKNFLHAIKVYGEWGIIIACSLFVACVVIYYLVPLVVEI